jgi:hypothetical protein
MLNFERRRLLWMMTFLTLMEVWHFRLKLMVDLEINSLIIKQRTFKMTMI